MISAAWPDNQSNEAGSDDLAPCDVGHAASNVDQALQLIQKGLPEDRRIQRHWMLADRACRLAKSQPSPATSERASLAIEYALAREEHPLQSPDVCA